MTLFFQNLLTASFHGSVIIGAVLVLRLLLKSAPKRAVCFLWMLAFVRLLMPFQLESKLSLQPEAIPLEEAPFYESVFVEDIPTQDNENITIDIQPMVPAIPEDIGGESIGGGEVVVQPQPVPEEPTVIHWTQLLPYLWALGAMLMLLYAFGSYVHLKRTVREAVRVIGGWECDRIETAFILGYLRPRVYVPMGLTRRTRKHILSHEWAHLRSGDHWFKLLAYVALSLHWFNPLAWVAYRLMCKDMEHACDERVIRYMDLSERKQYSHALLTCSTNHSHYTPCPVAFGEVSVKSRILSVLNYRKPSFWITLIAVLAVIFVGVFLMTSPAPAQVDDDHLSEITTPDEPVSYTAPTYPDAAEVYTVSTVSDFLAALGSDRIIELNPGDYELWKADTYNTDGDTGEFYYWNTEFGRNELIIQNVENLVIRGSGRDHTEFISENLNSDVLRFENCSRIALEGFTAGHKQLPDSCGGGVIGLMDCDDVTMDDLGLYGCGAVGVDAAACNRMVVTDSHIYDCSAYGVRLADTTSTRFEYCSFYRIGQRTPADYGQTFIYLTKAEAAEFYSCSFTDSCLQTLVTETVSRGVKLEQLHFESNDVLMAALDIHSSFYPMVVDKCTFKDNNIIRWYGADQIMAVNRKGTELTAEMLNTENVETEPDAPPQTEVQVSTVDELLAAIGPDTAIILEAKEYDLSTAKDYGKGSSDYYSWYEGPDGPELYINNVSNFSITGQGQDKTTVSAVPRHANVLNFTACSYITITNLTAGHTREPGECSGGVLSFNASSQIDIYGCGLYGCGVYGVTTHTVEQISIASCEIYECSQGGVRFGNTNGITIKNSVFRDLGGWALQYDMGCTGIVTEGNTLPEVELNTPAPTAEEVPFNLILGTEKVNEYCGQVGEQVIVEVDFIPADMTVEWSTDNSNVVALEPSKLGSQCVLWIKTEGKATITATRGDETRTLNLTAESNPNGDPCITSIELRYANSRIVEFTEAVNHTVNLTLHINPNGYPVTDADVNWYSDDSSVASVRGNPKGCTITCEGVGETTINCEVLGKTYSVKVYVRESW